MRRDLVSAGHKLLPALLFFAAAACARGPQVRPGVIGPGIVDSLAAGRPVSVLILLKELDAPELRCAGLDLAAAQDSVLGSLEEDAFVLRRRFASVPALSGTLLSVDGAAALGANACVVRVDRNVGGGGSRR